VAELLRECDSVGDVSSTNTENHGIAVLAISSQEELPDDVALFEAAEAAASEF